MDAPLLEIEPQELRFTFELKKQSTCSIRLTNNSDDYVAFKVKTTSPKKYCVRPNVGVVPPKSSSDFLVTMQAQRTAPPDLICKDKFLIQSTVVLDNKTEEDITSSMFSKEDGRYVEDTKLKVALMSPPRSPLLMPLNGSLKQEQNEASEPKEQIFSGIDFLNPNRTVVKDCGSIFSPKKDVNSDKVPNGEVRPDNDLKLEEGSVFIRKEDVDSPKLVNHPIHSPKNEEFAEVSRLSMKKDVDLTKLVNPAIHSPKNELEEVSRLSTKMDVDSPKLVKDVMRPENKVKVVKENFVEHETFKKEEDSALYTKANVHGEDLVRDIEDIKSQLKKLELKLAEAEVSISKLTEDRKSSTLETQYLKEELALLRNRKGVKQVQVGFPLLYVVTVAMISAMLGYLLRNDRSSYN